MRSNPHSHPLPLSLPHPNVPSTHGPSVPVPPRRNSHNAEMSILQLHQQVERDHSMVRDLQQQVETQLPHHLELITDVRVGKTFKLTQKFMQLLRLVHVHVRLAGAH